MAGHVVQHARIVISAATTQASRTWSEMRWPCIGRYQQRDFIFLILIPLANEFDYFFNDQVGAVFFFEQI